jgi:dihydroceramidase
MIPRPLHLVLTLVLTIVWTVVGFSFLTVLGPDWSLYAPASCTPNCFCELPRAGQLVLQPANALSSLGFVAVGGWIMLGAAQYRWSALGILAGLWLGFVAITIGIGSLFLHASLTLWGQFADVTGMYLLGAFILARAVARWQRLAAGPAVALYLLVCAALVAALWLWPEARRWLFALLLLVALVVEWRFARPWRPGARPELLLLGLGLNLMAFAIWILDQTRIVCTPDSLWQGHAIWHLLGAAAVLALYGYYRGEQRSA